MKESKERKMGDSDCGPKLKQGSDGSLQKVLTRTMIDHEDIFGSQIRSSGIIKNHWLKEHRDASKHRELSLDLELASSHYTIHNEDSASNKHGIYDDNYSSKKTTKLSLGGDADTRSGRKTCNDKIICSPSLQSLHLEGSTNGKDVFTIPGAMNELEKSCSFRGRRSDDFNSISQPQSLTVDRENFLERKPLYQGVVEQCHEDPSRKNLFARRKLFISHEAEAMDLNKAPSDEPSVNPFDPQTFNSSQCTFSGVSHNEITASTVTNSPSKDISEHISKSTLGSLNFSSACECLSGDKHAVNGSKSSRPESADCGISFPEKTCQRISMSEVDVEKKKENKLHSCSQELLEGADSNRSPASCKSDCNTDDSSSNTKTRRGVVDLPNLSPSTLKSPESSLVAKEQAEQNVSHLSETQCPKREELAAEVDTIVRKGAVSLIHISCLTQNQDHNIPESLKRKRSCSAEREMPQSSSESFESIVLRQVDCSVDEYCVSSAPSEALCSEKKDNGVKLKRGRRMKDFRKDILPSLASLSRQEINEDIKIMKLALRSKEFKKHNSNNARRNDCISSLRGRRPRPRQVGRR